jgi:hypothetical protein
MQRQTGRRNMEQENFLERNLTALRRVEPETTAFLTAFARDDSDCIKEAEGRWDLFDGSRATTLMEADAAGDDGWLAAIPMSASAILVCGVAGGERIERLLGGQKLPLVVCERFPALLRQVLGRFNWSRHIATRRLRFVCGAEQHADEDVKFFHSKVSQLAGVAGMWPVGSSPWWDRVFAGTIHAMPSFPGLAAALERNWPERFSGRGTLARIAAFMEHYDSQPPLGEKDKLRVLGVVYAGTAAIKTILGRLCAGLREEGHDAVLELEHDVPDQHSARLEMLFQRKPDVLLNAIRWPGPSMGFLANFVTLPGATYMTDAPWLMHTPGVGPTGPTVVFSVDETYSEWMREHCGVEAAGLPLAASYVDQPPVGERDIAREIVFIGNVGDHGRALSSLPRKTLERLMGMFWEECDRDACGDIDRLAARACAEAGWPRVPMQPVHVLWGTLYRLAAIEALAGLPVAVYGGETWRDLLKGGPMEGAWRGWLEPERELPAVMARAQVNLNLTSLPNWYSGNMRTWDAAGLGTCVLHDRKRDVMKVFGEGSAMAYFSGPGELREKAAALLADPAQCRRLGLAAREVVLAGHTYRHRARALVAHLRTTLGHVRPRVNPNSFHLMSTGTHLESGGM